MKRLLFPLLLSCPLFVPNAVADVPLKDIKIQGERVDPGENDSSESVTLVGKRGVSAFLTKSLDAFCAKGMATAEHQGGGVWLNKGENVDLEAMIQSLELEPERFNCMQITGVRPDRADVDLLDSRVVRGLGVTVLLPVSN